MMLIIYYYSQIVQHVFNHEKALRAQVDQMIHNNKSIFILHKQLQLQAKKMNVESLRSNASQSSSAEIRIAKAAITICFLFVAGKITFNLMYLGILIW